MATSPAPVTEPKTDNDDAKDFVEHLRAVHFALLATCLALLVIVLGSSPDRFKNAFQQLGTVSETAAAVNSEWMPSKAREVDPYFDYEKWIPSKATDFVNGSNKCQQFRTNYPNQVLSSLPWTVVPLDADGNEVNVAAWLDPMTLQLHRLNTVSDFKELWNARFMIVCPVKAADHASFRVSFEGANKEDKDKQVRLFLKKKLFLDSAFPQFGGKKGYCLFDGLSDGTLGVSEVSEADKTEFHISDIVREHFPNEHLPYQQFADSFYDLDQATTGVQDASFQLAEVSWN